MSNERECYTQSPGIEVALSASLMQRRKAS